MAAGASAANIVKIAANSYFYKKLSPLTSYFKTVKVLGSLRFAL
jgi:hypothetical protein